MNKYVVILIILIFLYLLYSLIPSLIMKLVNAIKRKKSGNIIYLTFDDGPGIYTNELLDVLKKHDVKATFFLVSDFAKENEDIIKRMIKEGHRLEFHSKSHKDALFLDYRRTKEQVYNGLEEIRDMGIRPKYFRAPWGRYNIISLYFSHKLGVKPILWNVMAEDWKNTTPEIIEKKILKRVNGGDIICLHDNRGFIKDAPKNTIKALDNTIPKLKNKGFLFKVVE